MHIIIVVDFGLCIIVMLLSKFFKEKNSALIENHKFRSSTQADWGTSLQYAKKKQNQAKHRKLQKLGDQSS